jgi:hypothetical protein
MSKQNNKKSKSNKKNKQNKLYRNKYNRTRKTNIKKGGSCKIFDTDNSKGKLNPTWETCITANNKENTVTYVTSSNVIIKSIESLQIPEFKVKIGSNSNPTINCKIMIEDKYVGCFLRIDGSWYALMRMFGSTYFNTGILAQTEKYKAFYKLTNIIIDEGTSLVILPGNSTRVNTSVTLKTSDAPIFKINDSNVMNINKTTEPNIFNIMQGFRQQKIIANQAKTAVAETVTDSIFDFGLSKLFS